MSQWHFRWELKSNLRPLLQQCEADTALNAADWKNADVSLSLHHEPSFLAARQKGRFPRQGGFSLPFLSFFGCPMFERRMLVTTPIVSYSTP